MSDWVAEVEEQVRREERAKTLEDVAAMLKKLRADMERLGASDSALSALAAVEFGLPLLKSPPSVGLSINDWTQAKAELKREGK